MSRPYLNSWEKRAIDVFGALILGLVFLPVCGVTAGYLAAGKGSICFSQRRVGQYGNVFSCYKFRTMVPDADIQLVKLLQRDRTARVEWERTRKLKDDPRITGLGRFLRRTSLDELPQLWNILKGDMSIVGPRPVVEEELRRYGRCVSRYQAAKPGLTGLWQVSGRSDVRYSRRIAMDRSYVMNASAILDIWIMLKTVGVVLGTRGAY